eukprot:gene7190-298_t
MVPEVNCRVQIQKDRATVRYVGSVQGQDGSWVGVEWDDRSRGKHDGVTGGIQYFQCEPNAGSFVRVEKVNSGVSLLAAVRGRYTNQTTEMGEDVAREEMYVNTVRNRRVQIELVGEQMVQAHQSHIERLTAARVVGATVSVVIFLLFVEDSIRKQYETTMLRQIEAASQEKRQHRGQLTTLPERASKGQACPRPTPCPSQAEITETFKKMLGDLERDHATQVLDPSYYQMLVRLPPDNASQRSIMVHDYFNMWTNTMFFGIELRLFIFEALFFCTVDMELRNIPVTAIITYVVIQFLRIVRIRLGEDNIAKKTLVSPHFLV